MPATARPKPPSVELSSIPERMQPRPEPILPKVAAGDPDAVRECIERFGSLIWSLARRMIADQGQAEDAVQEVFIELWKSAGRYDATKSSEAGFVATIARRRLIDSCRRAGRQPATEVIDETNFAESDTNLEQVDICDEADKARAAIASLRPVEREVLALSINEGWSHRQIAKAKSLPLGTVKSHIRRGLERVSEMLSGSALDSIEEVTP